MAWTHKQAAAYLRQRRQEAASKNARSQSCTPRTDELGTSAYKDTLRDAYRRQHDGADYNHGEECFITAWKQLAGVAFPFRRQVPIRESRNWKLDFFDAQTKIGIGIHGQVHAIKTQRQDDCEQWNACAEEGICLLHYTVEQVENDPVKVIAQVLALWHKRRERRIDGTA